MANMNFGVNILPKANNTYTLGNSDYKWNIFANTLNGVSLTNIITDIQINGISIVNNNIATIPLATESSFGIIKVGYGLGFDNNQKVVVSAASSGKIKAGADYNFPIVPIRQHESVFYGLAKAAGDSTQAASDNAVGVYTDGAKTAIQNMLAVAPTANPVFTGTISLGRDVNSTVGLNSVALGYANRAQGNSSIAMGAYNYANTDASIALGYNNMAMGAMSFAGGFGTRAHGAFSYTFGLNTANDIPSYTDWTASTSYTVGDNIVNSEDNLMYTCIEANSDATFNYSKWIPIVKSTFIEKIGNGELNIITGALGAKSNARALDWNGNEYLNGDLYVRCNADSTGGFKVPIIDDNAYYGATDKVYSADKVISSIRKMDWDHNRISDTNILTSVSSTSNYKLNLEDSELEQTNNYEVFLYEITAGNFLQILQVGTSNKIQIQFSSSSSTIDSTTRKGENLETTYYWGEIPTDAEYLIITCPTNTTLYVFESNPNVPTKTSNLTNDSSFVSAGFADGGLVLTTGTLFAEEVNF